LAAGRLLVQHELDETNEVYRMIIETSSDARSPCSLEVDAGDGGQNVDPIGRTTELNNLAGRDEVFASNAKVSEAEGSQRSEHSISIGSRRPHEEVYVAGEPWMAMVGDRMATDDDELNFVRVQ
jgi:hypothetical protein